MIDQWYFYLFVLSTNKIPKIEVYDNKLKIKMSMLLPEVVLDRHP